MTKDQVLLVRHVGVRIHEAENRVMTALDRLGRGPSAVEDAAAEADLLHQLQSLEELTGKLREAVEMHLGAGHILDRLTNK